MATEWSSARMPASLLARLRKLAEYHNYSNRLLKAIHEDPAFRNVDFESDTLPDWVIIELCVRREERVRYGAVGDSADSARRAA